MKSAHTFPSLTTSSGRRHIATQTTSSVDNLENDIVDGLQGYPGDIDGKMVVVENKLDLERRAIYIVTGQ